MKPEKLQATTFDRVLTYVLWGIVGAAFAVLIFLWLSQDADAGVARGHDAIERVPITRNLPLVITHDGARQTVTVGAEARRELIELRRAARQLEDAGLTLEAGSLIECVATMLRQCDRRGGVTYLVHVSEPSGRCVAQCGDGGALWGDADDPCLGYAGTGECCHQCWEGDPSTCWDDCNMDGCADNDPDCCPIDDLQCNG